MLARWAVIVGLLVLSACAEARPVRCRCQPPEVGPSGCLEPWAGYNEGIRWHTDLEEAFQLARQEKKLVFYFLVVGDLDKSQC